MEFKITMRGVFTAWIESNLKIKNIFRSQGIQHDKKTMGGVTTARIKRNKKNKKYVRLHGSATQVAIVIEIE